MKEELDNLFKSDIENCLKLTRKINMDCSSLSNINIVSLTDSGTTIKIYNPLQKKIYILYFDKYFDKVKTKSLEKKILQKNVIFF